jgi:hypothetical protein
MGKITFRVDRLVPADMAFGANYSNPYVDELVAIGQEIDGLPDDDAQPTLQDPAEQAVLRLLQVPRRHVQLMDQFTKNMNEPVVVEVLRRQQDAAAGALPTSGWAAAPDLWSAQAGERARVLREMQIEAAKAAVAKVNAKLGETATACVEAMAAFAEAIDRAKADFEVPDSLKADVDLTDLQKRADLENEIDSHADGAMVWTYDQIMRAIQYERADVLKNLIPAARRAAVKIIKTPLPKLARDRQAASHYTSDYASITQDNPHVRAQKVLAAIKTYCEGQRPQSIAICQSALDRMKPIFAAFLGVSPDVDMGRLYYVDSAAAERPKPWQIDATWASRFLPPAPAAPFPGWSKIVSYTVGRIPIREPKDPEYVVPAPVVAAEIKNLRDSDELKREALVRSLRGQS